MSAYFLTVVASIALATLSACISESVPSDTSNPAPQQPAYDGTCYPYNEPSFTVLRAIARDIPGFTEGLIYVNGKLIESTGNYGQTSYLNSIDPKTGLVTHVQATPGDDFGEGVTQLNGLYYQLTFTEGDVFIYDSNFKLTGTKPLNFANQGWGLTNMNGELVASDGSNQLRFINPGSLSVARTLSVADSTGHTYNELNSLQAVGPYIFANVYEADTVLQIDSRNGCVTALMNLASLRTMLSSNPDGGVLNGIAFDPQSQTFYLTGKNWPEIFQLQIHTPLQ